MRLIITSLILLLLLSANAYADSGTVKMEKFTYKVIYSSELDKLIFVQWNEEMNASLIKICNPLDFTVEKLIVSDDGINNIYYLQSSNSLLIYADQIGKNGFVLSSVLRKIDFESGDIIAEIDFDRDFNYSIIDHNQKNAYIYSGHESGNLYKIDIEDFEVVADIFQYGRCLSMATSMDDSKVYIFDDSDITIPSPNFEEPPSESSGYSHDYRPQQRFFMASVFDTQDLTSCAAITTIMSSSAIFMLDDGRLIFLGSCYREEDPSPDLIVIDTQTDEIVEILDLGDLKIREADIDKRHNKIYTTIAQKVDNYSEVPDYQKYDLSGLVLEINLDDYSHRLIKVCDKPLFKIHVIPTDTGARLICLEYPEDESDDSFIHYLDVS